MQTASACQESGYCIALAGLDDLRSIQQLYTQAIKLQKERNAIVWDGIDTKFLRQEISERHYFKIIDEGEIAAAFAVMYSDPHIWTDREDGTAVYFHRLVTHPQFKGRQYFAKTRDWLIQQVKGTHIKNIRIDTWTANKSLIAYYQKFGFQVVDEYTTENTEKLPIQHRNLNVTLLEYRL